MTGAGPEPTTAALVFGRWGVSLRVWSLVSVLLLVPITLTNAPGPPGRALMVAIVGCLAFGLVLLVARMTWLRLNVPWLPRPVLVLAAWIGACVFRLVALGATTGQGFAIGPPRPAAVLVPGVLAIVAAMALMSYVFGLRDSLTATSRDLAAATEELAERRSRSADTLRRQADLLISSVSSDVLPAVDSLVQQISSLDRSTGRERLQECAEAAGDTARSVVREVSHRVVLAAPGDGAAIDGEVVESQRARRRLGPSTPTTWSGVLLLLACLPALAIWIPRLGASSLVVVLVCLLPWLLSTPVAEGLLRPATSRLRTDYVLWVAVVSGAVTAALIVALGSWWSSAGVAQAGPFLAYFWAVGLVAALLSRDLTALDSRVRDLRQAQQAIATTLDELDTQIAIMHRKVGQVLHGSVQGTLSAVALALRLAANSEPGDTTTDEVLSRCRELLLEVTSQISSLGASDAGDSTPIDERLRLLTDRWVGLVTLTFVVDEGAADLLAHDEGAARAVMSVVEEAVHNAARHGRATVADIRLGLRDGTHLIIEVADDGTGPPASPRVGLGLAAVGSAGGTWRLDRLPEGGAHLAVTLPVGQ